MSGTYEIDQATGAQTQILLAAETDWGVVNGTPHWKRFNTIAGEGLDENITLYRSNVIRSDRMKNGSIRGSTKPGGALPFELAPRGVNQLLYQLFGWKVSSTGSGTYVHVLKGHTGVTQFPKGVTIEKGFLDLATPDYCGILGCRVNGMSLNFNVDQAVAGSFDIMGREFYVTETSLCQTTPDDLSADPYTSVDVGVFEGSSLVPLGTARQLTLNVTNGIFGDNNRLGSKFRANLKPGTRTTGFTGQFMFQNMDLYNRAVSGADTKLQIVVSNGTYSHVFLLPNADLLPNGSSPKITGDGPLEIKLDGEGKPDTVLGTDIQCTITCPESDITGLAA